MNKQLIDTLSRVTGLLQENEFIRIDFYPSGFVKFSSNIEGRILQNKSVSCVVEEDLMDFLAILQKVHPKLRGGLLGTPRVNCDVEILPLQSGFRSTIYNNAVLVANIDNVWRMDIFKLVELFRHEQQSRRVKMHEEYQSLEREYGPSLDALDRQSQLALAAEVGCRYNDRVRDKGPIGQLFRLPLLRHLKNRSKS